MSVNLVRAVRWIIAVAGAIAYPVLAHYSATTAVATTNPSLGVVVSLAPCLAMLVWLAWRSPRSPVLLFLCAVVGALLWEFWTVLERNFSWVYFLQHAGTYIVLTAVFGVTLTGGRQPLCTRLAEAVHGSLSREEMRYSRQVTLAWTMLLLTISLVSGVLFFFFSIAAWSVFANFVSLPLVALMFVAEYLVRLRKLPHHAKHSILATVRAYRKSPAVRPDFSTSRR